jgi:hypothetical protein
MSPTSGILCRRTSGTGLGYWWETTASKAQSSFLVLPATYRPSAANSAWLRGYPEPPPSTLIVLGQSGQYLEKTLTSCRLAGHNSNPYGVQNEESEDHSDIFVCGAPRMPWPEFWKQFQGFG